MMDEEKLSAATSPVKESTRSGSRELWAKKLISRDVQTDKYSSAAGIFHSSSSSEKVKSHFFKYPHKNNVLTFLYPNSVV